MGIKLLADGKYLIRVTKVINGKRKEKKAVKKFSTKGQAVALLKAFEKELNLIQLEEEKITPLRWHNCLGEYLEFAEQHFSPSTFYNRKKCLYHTTKEWMDRSIDTLTTEEISNVVNNNSFTDSYRIDLLKFIRAVFEFHLGMRKIIFNPCKLVRVNLDKARFNVAKSLQAMTPDEINTLLSYVKNSDENWFFIFYITYHLGLRFGEAVALKVNDIDWDRRIVTISKSWCKKKQGTVPPKNGTSRKIAIHQSLYEVLHALAENKKPDDFLLPRVKMWLQGYGSKILQQFQVELGIKRTNYHSIRASFITHLLLKGVPLVKVQAMVGHCDLKTTQRYIRLDATDLYGATDVLENMRSGPS